MLFYITLSLPGCRSRTSTWIGCRSCNATLSSSSRPRPLGTAFRQEHLLFCAFLCFPDLVIRFVLRELLVDQQHVIHLNYYFPHTLWDVEINWGDIYSGVIYPMPVPPSRPTLRLPFTLFGVFMYILFFRDFFPFFDIFGLIGFAFSMFVCFLCGRWISNLNIDNKNFINH